MNQKLLSKVLATILVITLTFTNFILLGVYATNTYGANDTLEEQGIKTNNENVEFDAYFVGKDEKAVHSITGEISSNIKLYLSVNVKQGYLKDAKVQMLGENGQATNFKMVDVDIANLNNVEDIDFSNNQISLKQLNSGTNVVLEIPLTLKNNEIFDLSEFSKINNITLTGSYVNNNAKSIAINKTVKVRVDWTNSPKVELEQSLVSFVPFKLSEKSGTILQTSIKTRLENNSLPIKETIIDIDVPEMDGALPENIRVLAVSTDATNGKNTREFSSENYVYNKEEKKLTIKIDNKSSNNTVSWKKGVKDEFIITYVYDKELSNINANEIAKVDIEAYNNVETKVNKTNVLKIEANEKQGDLVSQNINVTETLSKGNLYNSAKREVAFNEEVKVELGYIDVVDAVEIDLNEDSFINKDENVLPAAMEDISYTYYKKTTISKDNFIDILGEDGFIKINDKVITKNTEADENGNYVVVHNNVNSVKIETSKPIKDGILVLNNEKALTGEANYYSKAQVKDLVALQTNIGLKAKNADTEIVDTTYSKNINMVEPTTKIEASINNSRMSTVVENKNVELKVILKTNDITCDLFKNPVVEIVLPSYIENLQINNAYVLFDDDLKVKDYTQSRNQNGEIVLRVTLEGEDTVYNGDELTKGANLNIDANITVGRLTPTTTSNIKVYVTNELATSYEKTENKESAKGFATVELKAIAPSGVVTINEITGYNDKNETITSISGEEKTGKLDVNKGEKVATVNMNIINNYENEIKNIKILGRLPVSGTTDTENNEDMGSNLDLFMKEKIKLAGIDESKAKVYYSSNGQATNDLNAIENKWTENVEDLSSVKSYLIDLQDSNLKMGNTISGSYKIDIPENMTHNMEATENYTVYFDDVKQDGVISEMAIAPKMALSTGAGPNLAVELTSDIGEGNNVEEGKIITYTISVKNNGEEEAKNVTVSGSIPEKTYYALVDEYGIVDVDGDIKEFNETIESIAPGETKQVQYKVKTYILNDSISVAEKDKLQSKELEASASAKVDEYDTIFESNKTKVNLIEGFLNVSMIVGHINAKAARREGETVSYAITVQNVNYDVKENVKVNCKIPDGLTYKESQQNMENIDASVDSSTNTITWDIGTIAEAESKYIVAYFTVDKLENNVFEKTIKNSVTAIANGKEVNSNEATITVKKANLSVEMDSETKSEVGVGDSIVYDVIVQNTGTGIASDIVVTTNLSEGLNAKHVEYVVGEENYEAEVGGKSTDVALSGLDSGASVEIKITAEAEELDDGETKREVTAITTVSAYELNDITSEAVKTTVVPKQIGGKDDPSAGEIEKGTHSISGIAWSDSNNNGKQDDDERRISNIQVMLVDAETGKIVKDITTGREKKQYTSSTGEYIFANLRPGKYMVVFLYDTTNYSVTSYKQSGVIDSKNSDAVDMNVTYEGATRLAAVSDKLEIGVEDILNIDLGLTDAKKFDLSLDKIVTRITENNSKGSTVHEYTNGKLAKLDIPSKTMKSTTIIVEYKMTVKNEGNVAGFAKKIIDYLPKDMRFSSELNKDWYMDTSGKLINASLANTLINPGETKEITLLLTKKMDGENTGNINNVAEIYEAYNEQGLQDIDSTPANNIQSEDDRSSADAIIGVRTGEVYVYTVLTTVMIVILAVGIYFIKKKVLTRV